MQFRLSFSCDNAAFADPESGKINAESRYTQSEIVYILRQVAERIENGDYFDMYRDIKDSNGNIVGTFALKDQ